MRFLIRNTRLILLIILTSSKLLPSHCINNEDSDTAIYNIIYDYSYKGWYNVDFLVNLDTAEHYLSRALELQYEYYDTIDDRVANNLVNLASVYRRVYNYSAALEYLNKAERILNEFDPNNLLFGNIYNNKGNIYRSTNDFYKTKEYYEYALDFLTKNGYQNTTNFSHILSNYLKLLFDLGEDRIAESKLSDIDLESLNLSSTIELRFHLVFATAYTKLDNYESAKFHLNKAKTLLQKEKGNELNTDRIGYYYQIIDFYILYGEYDLALKNCAEASTFIETLNSESTKNKTIYKSNILYRSAAIHFRLGDYPRALNLTIRGINDLNEFFNNLSFSSATVSVRNQYSSILPELHILKSQILYKIYETDRSLDNLKSSFDSYRIAIGILNDLKLSMLNEESKVYATSQVIEIYNEAINVGITLYNKTQEINFLENSFEFAESSKSFALFSEIKNVEAMEFSDLPPKIKEEEDNLIGKIQAFEELLLAEQLKIDPDSSRIIYLKDRLFHLKKNYDNFLHELELNNAQYYELKYNPEFTSLNEAQDMMPYSHALIEYVLTDTILITFVIDKRNISVFSQEIDEDFQEKCMEYYRLIHAQNFSSGVHENYKRFVSLGREFYQTLVEPCLEYTDRTNLTIVPDGAITYLPFESFLTEDTDTEYINYLELPYLVRDYSIGYSHSSTLLFSERLKTKSPESQVLAFAPNYEKPEYAYDSVTFRQAISDAELFLPLYGTINEVQSIKETVPSRVFLNEKATEENFKKHAADYNVLHLAMHTIMRDDNPLYSMLAFTNTISDTTEDNRLYAYEIYNMKLNAQMAVLSSCSSGFGKMQKGEGMMSLARGFFYAGCPSIVMSLWQVSDQSSSELMTSFYRYLKKGKSKQEAMRMAKIDYLETADDLTSNPYFWSAFVVVGDSSPIYRKSGITYWIIIISIFAAVLVFFQYRYKRYR